MSKLFLSAELYAGADRVSEIIREICERLDEKHFDVSPYSETITHVGIIVNCFPEHMMAAGWGKPRTLLRYQKGEADIRLPLPYVAFKNADAETQFRMVVKNILESVSVIGERCKKSRRAEFDSAGMNAEILRRLGLTAADLDGVTGVMQ